MTNRGAWLYATTLALGGMLSCAAPIDVDAVPDDGRIDAVWGALARGDLAGARVAADRVEDPSFSERAQRDIQAAVAGRSTALVACLERQSWLAARYDASSERALQRLAEARRNGVDGACLWIEEGRRSASRGRQLSAVRAAQAHRPGGPEALAIEIETLLADGSLQEAGERLAGRRVDGARLRLAERRWQAATGAVHVMCEGVLVDLAEGWAVPTSLSLLEGVLLRVPDAERERAVRAILAETEVTGARMQRARERLLAILDARAGNVVSAGKRLSGVSPRWPSEDAALRRWALRVQAGPTTTMEERIEADAERVGGPDMLARRLADEWDLAARASYRATERGQDIDLSAFTARLDEAAATIPGSPTLSDLPRREYGVFGATLDTTPLAASLPDAFVLAGKALGLPAEITWYDRIDSQRIELGGELGSYEQCLVRHQRVLGYAASRGANISGAGIDRSVYLDLDQIEAEARSQGVTPIGPELGALPAVGREERLEISEPLDVSARLARAAQREAGDGYATALLGTVAVHERQHIEDFQLFVQRGFGGKLWSLLSAGLLPGSVRAEVERRAQLKALRETRDPRLALSQAVAYLPAEGARLADEHAVGYAVLVSQFLVMLDAEAWPGSRPLAEYGIDRERVLLQQLDRLPPETIRAIARALPD